MFALMEFIWIDKSFTLFKTWTKVSTWQEDLLVKEDPLVCVFYTNDLFVR